MIYWASIVVAGLVLTCPPAGAAEGPSQPAGSCGPAGQGLRLPGSDTCVRLGGFARAEAAARSTSSTPRLAIVGASATSRRAPRLRAQGQVDLDVRTETGAGPVRAFLSVRTPSKD